jgi:hypothetical protein
MRPLHRVYHDSTCSRAEGNGVVGLLAGGAGEESALRGLVVGVRIRVGAVRLEVAGEEWSAFVHVRRSRRYEPVVRHAAGRARRGRVVRARAARRAVRRVRVDQARALAADGEAGAVEGALERGRAVRAEVDRAVRDAAALVVRDAHGEVVPVDERDVIVVVTVRGRE